MKKIILIAFVMLVITGCASAISDDERGAGQASLPILLEQNFYDMGDIAMEDGDVTANFKLINTSEEAISVKEMETSCMCTTARLTVGQKSSNEIGMRGHGYVHNVGMNINPGEEAVITAVFDPNAHGPSGTGFIRRSVFLKIDSVDQPEIRLDFQATVFKTRAELPPKEIFELTDDEFDFGVIKQSGGIVKHDFSFTYNGNESIEIVGLPTSCGCTSASIDKDKLSKGDRATITVLFDPNLHAEPDGRFFKTVSLVTEPALEDELELKIWAEMDLDLGEEAFKLQSDHDDEEEGHEEAGYTSITPSIFADMLESKDFTLIDVHIPEQNHIAGTDSFIPYNQIENNINQLPKDKSAKLVVYCRSGSMSRAASYQLAEMGYTDVYDLIGGKNAYDDYIR